MLTRSNIITFYIASILFILGEGIFIVLKNNYIAVLLPVVAIMVYWALFSLDTLILFIVLCTPLSIKVRNIMGLQLGQIGIGMALPTEPLMFGIMLLFILHLCYAGIDKRILKHPISVIILLGIAWLLITSFTSSMPLVSFKFLIERCWTVVVFYFLGIILFKNIKNMVKFNWLYIAGLTAVVFYTIARHAPFHFSEKEAHIAVKPFYNDHTAYGALLAMFIPVVGGLIFIKKTNSAGRIIAPIFFLLFLVALALSYSRAAWVSIIVATGMFILMLLRVKLKWILIGLFICIGLFFNYETKIIMKLQRNNSEVSQNLSTEIESISNISSDASNLERLNRWSCAWRMFLDKPVFGFGPGTYSFTYAPYQLSYMKTIISTDLGTNGNAHSEYLGPLSEQGALGMLLFLALTVAVIALSFRLYYTIKDKQLRIMVISIFLGLLTYFVHGFMNNFLDTDKASVPFWGFIAMLVAIDLNYNSNRAVFNEIKEVDSVSESGSTTK